MLARTGRGVYSSIEVHADLHQEDDREDGPLFQVREGEAEHRVRVQLGEEVGVHDLLILTRVAFDVASDIDRRAKLTRGKRSRSDIWHLESADAHWLLLSRCSRCQYTEVKLMEWKMEGGVRGAAIVLRVLEVIERQ